MYTRKREPGFSMVELLVAMVVGLVIMSGVFALHTASRKTQKVNETQMDMVSDARFAIETIAYDLRHAGMWGATNRYGLIDCTATGPACSSTSSGDTPPEIAVADCAPGWFRNLKFAVYATDGTAGNPYATTCIPPSEGYVAGTDILDIRYADSGPAPVPLDAGTAHVRSNFDNGRIFIGSTQPVLPRFDASSFTGNHVLHAFSYYISDHTDAPGDGIPSLRRVALVSGPEMQKQTLLAGVVNLQVQFGEDTAGGDMIVDSYVDPQNVGDWANVYAARIWLVLRSDNRFSGIDTGRTFDIAGQAVNYGGMDGYRYFMVSTVVDLRNMKQF